MLNRRFTGIIASLLLLPAAACGAPSKPAAPAAAEKPFDAKAVLAASTSGIQAGDYTFRFTRPGNDVASGTVHRPSRSIGMKMTMKLDEETSAALDLRVIGPKRYQRMKIDAATLATLRKQKKMLTELGRPNNPKVKEALAKVNSGLDTFGGDHWNLVDKSKIKDSSLMEYDVDVDRPDVTGAGALVGVAATAAGDKTSIKGTLDATRMTGAEELINKETFKDVPLTTAEAVPFVATLDADGRMTKLAMELPAAEDHPAGTWTVEFTGYGAAPAQQAPSAREVKEATPEMYDMFNE